MINFLEDKIKVVVNKDVYYRLKDIATVCKSTVATIKKKIVEYAGEESITTIDGLGKTLWVNEHNLNGFEFRGNELVVKTAVTTIAEKVESNNKVNGLIEAFRKAFAEEQLEEQNNDIQSLMDTVTIDDKSEQIEYLNNELPKLNNELQDKGIDAQVMAVVMRYENSEGNINTKIEYCVNHNESLYFPYIAEKKSIVDIVRKNINNKSQYLIQDYFCDMDEDDMSIPNTIAPINKTYYTKQEIKQKLFNDIYTGDWSVYDFISLMYDNSVGNFTIPTELAVNPILNRFSKIDIIL